MLKSLSYALWGRFLRGLWMVDFIGLVGCSCWCLVPFELGFICGNFIVLQTCSVLYELEVMAEKLGACSCVPRIDRRTLSESGGVGYDGMEISVSWIGWWWKWDMEIQRWWLDVAVDKWTATVGLWDEYFRNLFLNSHMLSDRSYRRDNRSLSEYCKGLEESGIKELKCALIRYRHHLRPANNVFNLKSERFSGDNHPSKLSALPSLDRERQYSKLFWAWEKINHTIIELKCGR